MRAEIKDSSILIISHQERILNIADEIIVLKNGTVDRQGPRDVILPTLMNYSEMTPGCGKADVEGDGKSC